LELIGYDIRLEVATFSIDGCQGTDKRTFFQQGNYSKDAWPTASGFYIS
jgi:hypothetical protein